MNESFFESRKFFKRFSVKKSDKIPAISFELPTNLLPNESNLKKDKNFNDLSVKLLNKTLFTVKKGISERNPINLIEDKKSSSILDKCVINDYEKKINELKNENNKLKSLLQEKAQENEKLTKLNYVMKKLLKKKMEKSSKQDNNQNNEIDYENFVQEIKTKSFFSYFKKEGNELKSEDELKIKDNKKTHELKIIKSEFKTFTWQNNYETLELATNYLRFTLKRSNAFNINNTIGGLFEIEQEIYNTSDEIVALDKMTFSHSKSIFY